MRKILVLTYTENNHMQDSNMPKYFFMGIYCHELSNNKFFSGIDLLVKNHNIW